MVLTRIAISIGGKAIASIACRAHRNFNGSYTMSDSAGGPAHRATEHTVVVADDNVLVRRGLKLVVRGMFAGVRFVEVADGIALLNAARAHPAASLALVDADLPDLQGSAALGELAVLRPTLPLVVVSACDSIELARRVATVPTVHAFVSKRADIDELRLAIDAAMHGMRTPALVPGPGARRKEDLAPRQDEVHRLFCQGMGNKDIAARLGISEAMVESHLREIFRLLNSTAVPGRGHACPGCEDSAGGHSPVSA